MKNFGLEILLDKKVGRGEVVDWRWSRGGESLPYGYGANLAPR
jgi:hypothetical protein